MAFASRNILLRLHLFLAIAIFSFFTTYAQNPIVTENALEGNFPAEWDIVGAGDLTIQGFATDISYNKGQTVQFKIQTDASAYTIDIYRLGYYNGRGARKVGTGTITATLPQVQPDPITQGTTGLVDCGNWNVSATWAIPGSAVSGIYIAKLTRTDNSGSSHIVFIVRDDASHSDLFFQTSDATWQAYNVYGGNSLYSGITALPNGHAAKVSYNRPILTRNGGGGGGPAQDWLFNAEYPMLRFLEANGYDVTYTTNVDAARFGSLILNHKVFLSVGHDEYWSAAQRTNVEAARNAGVHLAFFSGNEIYWKTRFENSTDISSTPYRTLVCYKEGTLGETACGGKCDPSAEWTGLWRDGCSFPAGGACKPENQVSGQISWVGGMSAMEVPAVYKDLRFWRNTSVASLGTGGVAVFPSGVLGNEWSYEQFPDHYPAGRITMSSTTADGKTHKLSLYRHSSGALVFGAGTINWAWGLDDKHDGAATPTSQDMRQATINLFADMGVQPGSLQAGLISASISTDTEAPTVIITSPAHQSIQVLGSPVTISGIASDAGGVVAGIEISVDGGTTWHSASGTAAWTYTWTPNLAGTYSIKVRGVDDSGNLSVVGAVGTGSNITVDAAPAMPGISVFAPTTTPVNQLLNDGNLAIETGMRFRTTVNGTITSLRYYKGAGSSGIRTGHLWSNVGTQLAEAVFTNETTSGWQEIQLSTPVNIVANTTYVVSVHSQLGFYTNTIPYFATSVVNGTIRALADNEDGRNGVFIYSPTAAFPTNTFNASNYWVDVVFVADELPDAIPPGILSVSPSNGAMNVNINSSLTAEFDEDIAVATLTNTTFKLVNNVTGLAVPASVSYNATTKIATLVPTTHLLYGTSYTASVVGGPAGVADLLGNTMAADYNWTFITDNPPTVLPTDGNGGPILVLSSTANPFSRYTVEILRAEGLNSFTAADISTLNSTLLNQHDVVVLGEMPVNPAQVTLLTDWVNAGGTLIAFKPDPLLLPLLGLSASSGTLSDKYLLVNTSGGPGAGIVNETIQFHGTANLHTLNGASAIATLYSDVTTATAHPATSLIQVGSNGGRAVAFTYDLAKSIIYTRQGNPAWAGTERDALNPIRSNDLFFGLPANTGADWIDFSKIHIPQADEQQRFLANIILQANLHRKPLPRFWYLPRDLKAAIVMTGDDHGTVLNATSGRFDRYSQISDSLGTNSALDVAKWRAIRASSYIYPNTILAPAAAIAYQAQGFEIGVHPTTNCTNFTEASLSTAIGTGLGQFANAYPGLGTQVSSRTHCLLWSDWATQAKVEMSYGIRFDVNYYYWPGSWVQNRPGMFTGSGMPMRFADLDGTLIDCYQAPTQMTDEAGISNMNSFCNQLLDKALGIEGYYGVFTANMHHDSINHVGANAIIASALARQVPIISAKQMLNWLDGRNNSFFADLEWNNNQLSFTITAFSAAVDIRAMLPLYLENGAKLVSVKRNNVSIPITPRSIKGMQYGFFDAAPGTNAYTAEYVLDLSVPVIENITVVPNNDGTAIITWSTTEPTDSRIDYSTNASNLDLNVAQPVFVTNHSVTLTGLAPLAIYYFRVTSADLVNVVTEPTIANQPLSFVMPAFPCVNDNTESDFGFGTTGANTTASGEGDGGVILKPASNEDFSGSAVPAGWGSGVFNVNGSTAVNNGFLTVNGAHAFSNASYGQGTSIEFVATFRNGTFQNIGFTSDQAFNLNPWVTIGQAGALNGNLYSRASNGTLNVLGTNLIGTPHRYKISWINNDFYFYVDGVLVPTATITIPVAVNMYLQVSDVSHLDEALSIDWMRVLPYSNAGTYLSRVFNAGSQRPWGEVSWTTDTPAGTSVAISVRTGNTAVPDGTWSDFVALPTSGTPVGATSQYIQYKADLASGNVQLTPVLRDIKIECSSPAAITTHPVSQALCEGAEASFTSEAIGFPVPTVQWQVSTDGTNWSNIDGAVSGTLTFTPTLADNSKQYRAVWTNGAGIINSNVAVLTVHAIPSTPTILVTDNCGSSTLTVTNAAGSLLWNTTETTTSIVVTSAGSYSVTQSANGCTSAVANAIATPKVIPAVPLITVVNNCGSSSLTASNYTGSLLWSTGETTETITVTAGTYTLTQEINGCVSDVGSAVAEPKLVPAAPTVTVVNNCGGSELTASGFTGALLWSNGATTSTISVTDAATYTVTQTIDGCTSVSGSGVSLPGLVPPAPIVTVVNNCGSSELTASMVTGALLWSNGATTASITVTDAATYTVTQTVDGCVSPAGLGVSAPKVVPAAPIISVTNNCGSSELVASAFTGDLLWNTGSVASSITVTDGGVYTVTQTVDGCLSSAGSATAVPKVVPAAPIVEVINNCGSSILTAIGFTGDLLWSNGATTTSITVNDAALYSVTQTIDGCTSLAGSGLSAPKVVPAAPVIIASNNCAESILTATGYTGSLLWSNGATTESISVTNAATYSVTQTVDGCTSVSGIGVSAPKPVPSAPTVAVTNNCQSSTLIAQNYTGSLLWSTGSTSHILMVTTPGTYSVTQTVNGCESAAGTGISQPLPTPPVPTITTVDNCGHSVLTASNYTGALLWNTGQTTPSITVTAAGTYTLTQTVNGCTSPRIETRGGKATPKAVPAAPLVMVNNSCGNSLLTAYNYSGSLLWSNGATTPTTMVTAAGTYTVTQTVNGCVSPVRNAVANPKAIPAAPSISASGPTTFCVGGSVVLTSSQSSGNLWSTGETTQSITVSTAGSYTVAYTAANGCASGQSAPVAITVKVPTSSTTSAEVCSAELPYVWNANSFGAAGTYVVTLVNAAGCDSLATLILTVKQTPPAPAITVVGSPNICQGQTISLTSSQIEGNTWSTGETTQSIVVSEAGSYSVTYTAPNGCTSASSVPVVVTVSAATSSTTNVTICSNELPYLWNDQSYTAAGTYNVAIGNGTGCDSIAILVLTVKDTSFSTTNVTICSNEAPYNFNGVNYFVSGTYPVGGFTNVVGCDSTAILVLTVNAVTADTTEVTVCSTELPYVWNGVEYSATGIYTISGLTNQAGCDSTSTLALTVNAATASTTTETVCSAALPFVWNGNEYLIAGTYSMTFTNVAGCDSVATLVLIVNASPVAAIENNSATTVLNCTTVAISLTATGGDSYSWSDGTNVVSTTDALLVTAPGTYTVTVTAGNGCTDTESVTITQDNTIAAGITNNSGTTALTCTTTSISLTATGGVSYSWSDGTNVVSTTDALVVTAPGTYTVTVTGANGCLDTEEIVITQDNTILASITNNTGTTVLTCTTTSISLTATGGMSYSWSDGTNVVSTTDALIVTAPGTYTVTVTGANGCVDEEQIIITQSSTIVAGVTNNTGTTVLTCTTTSISLTATGGVSYSWSDGTNVVSTTDALTVTAPGTYTVTVTGANGCLDTEEIAITQDNTLVAGINNNTGTSVLTCTTTSISLTATGGVSYSWSDGTNVVSTTDALTVTAPGTYTVTVTGANGCLDTEEIVITQDNTILASITNNTGTTVLTCTTTSISLTATGGVSYSWSDGTNVVSTTDALVVTAPGTYTVTVTGANGCLDTEEIAITQDNTLVAGINNNTGTSVLTCTITSISLTATGGVSYSWSDGTNVVSTTDALIVAAPGTYTVTVTGANGCVDEEQVIITQSSSVVAGITNNTGTTVLTCTTTSISLTATGGVSYSWSDGTNVVSTTDALIVTAPGTYTVTVTGANGCLDTEEITITQDNTLVAGINNNTGTSVLTCTTTSISLTATGGMSYSWSDGTNVVSTTDALIVTAPGTYTVTVTGGNGCVDEEQVIITQSSTVVAGITNNTGTTVLTCTTSSISLTATGGVGYSWSDGTNVVSTTDALVVTAPGTYTVTVTGGNGCVDEEQVIITQSSTVVAGITNNTGTTVLTCTTSSISLTATGGVSYSWSDGTNVVSTTDALTVTAPGTYTVTVTGANGCLDTEEIVITQDNTILASITNNTGTTVLTCTTTSISLTATGGMSYSWSDGTNVVSTTDALTVTAPGTYTVTVTGANGCLDTEEIAITQDNTLVAGINNNTGTSVLTCTITSISLTATGGVSYSWSDGTNVVSTTDALTVTAPGTYTVTVTGANGCLDTEEIVITQDNTILASVTNNTGTTVLTCTTTSISLTATGGVSYSWSDGTNVVSTTDALIVIAPGTYTVTVTGANSCVDDQEIVITQDLTAPSIISTTPATRCGTGTINLSATASAGIVNWYSSATGGTSIATGNSFTTPSINTTTSYWVEAVNGTCISAARTEIVATVTTQSAAPTVTASGPLTICQNQSVTLNANTSGGLQWYLDGQPLTGQTSPTYEAGTSGNYTVTQTELNSCESPMSNIMTVSVDPIPTLSNVITSLATGSGELFEFTPTSDIPGTTFAWTRIAVDGVDNPTASGSGNIAETLTLTVPGNGSKVVLYSYTLTTPNGCSNLEPESVTVTINPTNGRMITTILAPALQSIPQSPATLEVKAMPNPTTSYFTLQIRSADNKPITLRLLNANGLLMEQRAKIAPNSTQRFGDGWIGGLYYAEIIQGDQRKIIKLVKAN